MAVILQNSTSAILTKISDELSGLPNQYIDFYKKTNGIIFTDSDEFSFYLTEIDDEISLEALFQIDTKNVNFDLLVMQREIGDDLPDVFWIIGGDAGGNFYLLHRHTQQIWYWDRTCLYGCDRLTEREIGQYYAMKMSFYELLTLIFQQIEQCKIIIKNK